MLWVLNETILMSTHNIGFVRELKDLECYHHLLSGALIDAFFYVKAC